jgi:hypothetical protein
VLAHPDELVGVPIELVGYAIVGFEHSQLAHSSDEVRVFDAWRAARPKGFPRLQLLGLSRIGNAPPFVANEHHGRRVRVRGRVRPAINPSEPNGVLRWAYGIGFVVEQWELAP